LFAYKHEEPTLTVCLDTPWQPHTARATLTTTYHHTTHNTATPPLTTGTPTIQTTQTTQQKNTTTKRPVERLKTVMQHAVRSDGSSPYRHTWHCAQQLVKEGGNV
jgi:hypothetical protein